MGVRRALVLTEFLFVRVALQMCPRLWQVSAMHLLRMWTGYVTYRTGSLWEDLLYSLLMLRLQNLTV